MSTPRKQAPIAAKLLRQRAEEELRDENEILTGMTPEQMRAVIHDLHVHQIELEMQNEQLRFTQAELETARERYTELYDFAPVGYLTVSKEGVILQANLTSVSMLGAERSRLLSLPFSRFVFTADQEAFYLCWRKVFDSGVKQVCEIRLRPNAGAVFYARLEAITALEGKDTVCLLTLSDITEQKQAEDSLRESEKRRLKYENEEWKRLALEAGELGAWDQDLRTGGISCSTQASAMLGFPSNGALSWETVVSRINPDDRPAFLQEVEKSADPNGPGRCESIFRIVLPDGSVRWVRFLARTFFEPGARVLPVRRTGILADITRLKEAEELLKSRAKQLDSLVRERTARLQEAVAELEHLSYTLVHDLRAPLRAIAGYSNLVLDQCEGLDPTHRKFLERSNSAAVRMDGLIVDALSYTKVVREKFPRTPIDCGALLKEVIESYPQFQEAIKSIQLEGPFPRIMGNTSLLTQCFSNLLTNALKFVPPPKAPLVRIFSQDKGERVRICFQDNGIGIDEGGQKKIFRMFQRLNRDYEGTGIGLALVKKSVERMHGAVGVESEAGHGSRFWLEFDKAPMRDGT